MGKTGCQPTLRLGTKSGMILKVTSGHPVFVLGRGFIKAAELVTGDRVIRCLSPLSDLSSSSRKKSISSKITAITERVEAEDENSYIGRYGNRPLAQFLGGYSFIILTMIGETILWRTLLASTFPNIAKSIPMASPYGILQDAAQQPRLTGSVLKPGHTSVGYVQRDSSAPVREQDFALVNIKSDIITSVTMGDYEPVWNLTVADAAEFFANGILVHNCGWTPQDGTSPDRLDAVVWALTELMLVGGQWFVDV